MLHRRVAPVLALGDDDAGGMLINEFVQAGATIQYITRRADLRSPVLAQELNTALGQHEFSFICPETREALPRRSEEHTSGLQSLMRISYAVFCLQKKKI